MSIERVGVVGTGLMGRGIAQVVAQHALLRKMVRGGRLGRKTGRGFFEYRE